MNILVLNAGSSTLKWQLYDMEASQSIASGLIEGIAEGSGSFHLQYQSKVLHTAEMIADHHAAFSLLFETLKKEKIIDLERDLSAIGHRVVHGGEKFVKPTFVDSMVLNELSALSPLAPLHNPANLLGMEITAKLAPQIPNIAVFDTAFHQSMPEHAYLYALPKPLYEEHRIRRYGFHGTSHHYVARQTAAVMKQPLEQLNLITLHLGNGASACAIREGISVDTSMGFTPLEGLVMGTRSGDLDPAIVTYLIRQHDMSAQEVDRLLNSESGLKGICGENDLRVIIERASDMDSEAQLALDIFTYRIKKYIGAYIAALGRVDAIVFTGGIGEHAPLIRAMVLDGLDDAFGIFLDESKNLNAHNSAIHQPNSRIELYVIATDEELEIAIESAEFLKNHKLTLFNTGIS